MVGVGGVAIEKLGWGAYETAVITVTDHVLVVIAPAASTASSSAIICHRGGVPGLRHYPAKSLEQESDAKSQALRNFEIRRREGRM
jgi:hypothetical protein